MRKILNILCVVFIVSYIFIPMKVGARSLDNQEMISIEEYTEIVTKECERVGISIQVISDKKMVPVESLIGAFNAIDAVANSQVTSEYNSLEIREPVDGVRGITGMPVDRVGYQSFTVTNLLGWAKIAVDVYVTIDAQNNHIISINNVSTYVHSGQNVSGWNCTGIGQSMNNPSDGYVTLNVNGIASFSYTDPVFGITNVLTTNVSQNVAVDCR